MAPKTLDEDFTFIMTCIKHSPLAAKPNFDEVAKELGAKSANACYHRHWSIMKKWGMAGGGVGRARRAGDTATGAGAAVTKPRVAGTKRKANELTNATSASEEMEEPVVKKTKAKKKAPPKDIKAEFDDDEIDPEQLVIKSELADDESNDDEKTVVGDGAMESDA